MAFKLAFSTLGCPNWTIEQVGEAARRYGYDGIEVRLLDGELLPPDLDAAGRQRIKRALRGLAIPSVDTSAPTPSSARTRSTATFANAFVP